MPDFSALYSMNANNMKASVIRELLKLVDQPGIISFAGGLPDPATFPVEDLRSAAERVFERRSAQALQYGSTEGDKELKDELIAFEARQGLEIKREEMLIVSASQQALDIACKVLLDPGDLVLAGRPTYLGEIQAVQSYRAEIVGVPYDADEEGFDMARLAELHEAALRAGRKVKYAYVIPDFQNPDGICWSLERRREFLAYCYEKELLIVEDAPYREIRFLGESLPSLYQLDQEGERRGIVLGFKTFSKILAPGTRMGWIIGHPALIARFVVAKQAMDLCSNVFTQAWVAEYLKTGVIYGHIAETRKLYREKRDRMVAALERNMPQRPDLRWTSPEGGLFLWVSLPEYIDAERMFLRAIEKKVAYVVGSSFYFDDPARNVMRLNFSYPSPEQIDEGVARLADCIREEIAAREEPKGVFRASIDLKATL
jgi:2-aminoadipate transaminase